MLPSLGRKHTKEAEMVSMRAILTEGRVMEIKSDNLQGISQIDISK
jgi:hypothetical protein